MIIKVPSDTSHNQMTRLKNELNYVMLFRAKTEADKEIRHHNILKACEKLCPDSFLQLSKEKTIVQKL